MRIRALLARAAGTFAVAALAGCTIVRVDTAGHPTRFEAEGLVNGYAAAGWPTSSGVVDARVLDGPSPGAIGRLSVWKLLRLEVGFVGLALGLGPLDVGLGTLFYEPALPRYPYDDDGLEPEAEPPAGDGPDDDEPATGDAADDDDDAADDDDAEESAGAGADGS